MVRYVPLTFDSNSRIGPCQQPMAHNVEIIKKKSAEWKDKASILCLSLDDSVEELKEILHSRSWDVSGLGHFNLSGSFGNPTARHYGVNGIPHCVLLDKQHKIVWAGYV
jgi:hypothetical protein